MTKKLKSLIISFLIISAILIVGNFVLAQSGNDLAFGGTQNEVGGAIGLGDEDPRVLIANIIRVFLGFLGIIAVSLVMYSGWTWMTAAGNVEKIDKAKKILTGAIIGIVIILSSFLVVTFILNKLLDASTGGAGEITVPPGGGGMDFSASSFIITSTSPVNNPPAPVVLNTRVRFNFNKSAQSETVDKNTFIITGDNPSGMVDGTRNVSGGRIIFTSSGDCPTNTCGATNCLPADNNIDAAASAGVDGILTVGDQELTCGGIGEECILNFKTSSQVDCEPPEIIDLSFDQICVGINNIIGAQATDNFGVDRIEFYVDDKIVSTEINSPPINSFIASADWSGTGYNAGDPVKIKATAFDIVDWSDSQEKTVILRPTHCCDGAQSGDEIGIDCGGSCGACNGAQCDAGDDDAQTCITPTDSICSSNFCDTESCSCEAKPRIDWISPVDGQNNPTGTPGNYITISGNNFGTTTGSVYFSSITDNDYNYDIPALVSSCSNAWQNKQIIVEVPTGFDTGPIKVVADNTYEDTTNDSYGNQINNFVDSGITLPGICSVVPASGFFNDTFIINGKSFSGANQVIKFGNTANNINANNINFISDTSAQGNVPNLSKGNTTTFVEVDGRSSNFLKFNVLYDASNEPIIDYISPDDGPPGEYITIHGSNFKSYSSEISKVEFKSSSLATIYSADGLDFPEECQDSWWRDTYIIVKVPLAIKDDSDFVDYEVTVTNRDNNISQSENFNVIDDAPGPGICKLDPYNGSVGQTISILGDNFGSAQDSGLVRFYNNISTTEVSSWYDQKINLNVPAGSQTGPVIVAQGTESNSLPFMVGNCTSDSECVGLDVCCGANTSWAGICRQASDCTAPGPGACTYGWTFTTSPSPNTPLTCGGYISANACLASGFCPNSPGECQTKTDIIVGSGCGTDYCNSLSECTSGQCVYDSALNKCKLPVTTCDETNGSLITGYTATCSDNGVWQIDSGGASCPMGTYLDTNNFCTVGVIGNPTSCDICDLDFSCQLGECVIDNNVCPSGSICDLTSGSATQNQCVSNDTCECCCRVGFDAQDCCLGLTCEAGGCGSDYNNYGLCTGCRVEVGEIVSQEASNDACNCSGSGTRYCDLSNNDYPNGVCRDTSLEGEKCYDADVAATCNFGDPFCAVGLFCNSSNGCICEEKIPAGGNCDSDSAINGCQYTGGCEEGYICDPDADCTCRPDEGIGGPGESCIVPDPTPTECTDGVSSCLTDYTCLNEPGVDCGCCCAPGDINAAGLNCTIDISPCSGATRGLYCGCSSDSQCGSTATIGCGDDTCCKLRPVVIDEDGNGENDPRPYNNSTNVCRNSKITATFDQKMHKASFTGNVIVVGDYGASQCPEDTTYLVAKKKEEKGIIARVFLKPLNFIKKMLPFISSSAEAMSGNFCAVSGTVSGTHNVDDTTTLSFSPDNILDANVKYYVVIKGDEDIDDENSEGVLSYNSISMNRPDNESFNAINYYGKIWSFTTMAEQSLNGGICKISRVDVSPNSYLFRTTEDDINEDDLNINNNSFNTQEDRDVVFVAEAVASNGQVLSEISVYNWEWEWSSDNESVVKLNTPSPFSADYNEQLYEAQTEITDSSATITAVANVFGDVADINESYFGQAQVWVFTCENPWPPVISGIWTPWSSDVGTSCIDGTSCPNVNYEFYYCRDSGGIGTEDDLPAINSDNTVIRGTSDTTDLLKEFYFFREEAPDVSEAGLLIIEDQSNNNNGKASVSWTPITGASSYKLYYGLSSENYSNYIDSLGTNKIIEGLNIGSTYYFAVTGIDDVTGAESVYSNEVSQTLVDTISPSTPSDASVVAGDSEVTISWTANVNDTAKYKIYYGTASGIYGGSQEVGSEYTSVIITGLTNGVLYYLNLTAIDSYDNESPRLVNELSATPTSSQ